MTDTEAVKFLQELHGYFDKPLNSVALRRAFLILARLHWGHASNHGDYAEMLKGLLYAGGPERTLKVDLFDLFKGEDREDYPAIFVGFRDGLRYSKVALDNMSGQTAALDGQSYTRVAKANMTLSHYHANSDTALIMAESTSSFLEGVRPQTMRNMGLALMEVDSLAGPSRVHSSAETVFKVDIFVGLSFNTAMTVTIESHRIKKWSAALSRTT